MRYHPRCTFDPGGASSERMHRHEKGLEKEPNALVTKTQGRGLGGRRQS